MNCNAPIEARCEVCRVRFPKKRCSSCEALVCEQCLDDWPGWIMVCRTCAEEVAIEARSVDAPVTRSWRSSLRVLALALLAAAFAQVAVAVAYVLFGGAQ